MNKHYYTIIFLVLVLTVYLSFGLLNELYELPKGLHQWKQSMHFSVTKNYANNQTYFFKPMMDNLFNDDGTGTVIQEFPVLNYIAPLFFNYFPYGLRIINFLISIFGILAFYKICVRYMQNHVASIFISINVLLIPIVLFYSVSYIVDMSALWLGIISVYMYEKYTDTDRKWLFIGSIVFFTLSGLIRLPVIIFPVGYFFVKLSNSFEVKKIIYFSAALIVIALWYIYVMLFNHYPISTPKELCYLFIDKNTLTLVNNSIFNFMIYQLGYVNSYGIYYLFILIFLGLFYMKIRDNKILKVWLSSLVLSSIYIYLWYGIFQEHDYYLIPIVPALGLTSAVFFIIIHRLNHLLGYIIMITIMILNTIYSYENIRWRTFQSKADLPIRLMQPYEEGIQWWIKQEDASKWKLIRELSPFERLPTDALTKYGILRGDTVFCTFDDSPTYVLSLLDLKGWSNYNRIKLNALDAIHKGAKYIVHYGKRSIMNNNHLDNLIKQNEVFKYDSIYIYDVRHLKTYSLESSFK